jgi:uncharacterized protein (TIGR02145 family)
MKEKAKIWIYILMSIGLVLTITEGCKKDSKVDYTGQKGTVTDIDGNIYQTIGIGTQIWMAENLKVTRYRNGDYIPNITKQTKWDSLTTGAYCWYGNNTTNKAIYGALYNWYAVIDSRNISPVGWHVPSDADWTTLTNYLGGAVVACEKMMSDTVWDCHYYNNSSGFTALPGGYRERGVGFYYICVEARFWSSSQFSERDAWCRGLASFYLYVKQFNSFKIDGYSVRCLKN